MDKIVLSNEEKAHAVSELEFLVGHTGKGCILEGASGPLLDFGEYMSQKLAALSVCTPAHFLLMAELAFTDLERGTDDQGVPIHHRAARYDRGMYLLIRMQLPSIAKAVFPPMFAAAVAQEQEAVFGEVYAMEQSAQSTEHRRARTIRCKRRRRQRQNRRRRS